MKFCPDIHSSPAPAALSRVFLPDKLPFYMYSTLKKYVKNSQIDQFQFNSSRPCE